MFTPQIKNITPAPDQMKNIWELLKAYPYTSHTTIDELYIEAMKEMIRFDQEGHPFYKQLLAYNDFEVDQLNSIDDLSKMAFIHANFFKTDVVKMSHVEDIR